MRFDAAIIGGGVAGLQAALTLGRARRSVLVMDAGAPRHRFASHMHNLLGADGLSPGEFYARAHAELAQYPNVKILNVALTFAQANDGGFALTDSQGVTHEARKLLFACGIVDRLPEIVGMMQAWGTQVLHCAYCHGYEQAGKNVAALTTAEGAWAMVESLWALRAKLHFFFERDRVPDEALLAKIRALGIAVTLPPIERIVREGGGLHLVLADESTVTCDVLFVKPKSAPTSIIPFQLGCYPVDDAYITVNEWGQTHAKGIYAAGDIAGGFQQLGAAQTSGLRAAVMLNTELTREALA